jgi:hypothetical protein
MMNKVRLLIVLLSILILTLPACKQEDPAGPLTGPVEPINQLEQLLLDVFAPQANESILVMIDLPHEFMDDNPAWEARREMAEEWLAAFQRLSKNLDFSVEPMLTYSATGRHNGPLPAEGEQDGVLVQLETILTGSNIVVAMTEYSATASLIGFTEQSPHLRAASMPLVSSSMMQTALAADYGQMAQKCHILAERLDRADSAWLTFSTGQELTVDLRFRQAEVDDGQLHADKQGARVINLPSGEAYIAPYEGELDGQTSKTSGEMPLLLGEGKYLTVQLVENRIVDVQGDGPAVEEVRSFFAVDEARRNLAELGLGCNDKAVISGNVLEDEKVMGVHLAAGLSEHIGGTVGVDDFENASNIVHEDRVYPAGGEIEVTTLILEYEDGSSETIIKDGRYTLFSES